MLGRAPAIAGARPAFALTRLRASLRGAYTGRRSNSIESTGSWNGALEVRPRSCPKGGVMRAGLFGTALSAALLAPFCAQAQDRGVFDKWLDQKAPVCVPVSDLKAVSRVTDLTPAQFQFVRALYVSLPPVSRTLPRAGFHSGDAGSGRRRSDHPYRNAGQLAASFLLTRGLPPLGCNGRFA